jgi:methionyl aminopeptidase
MRQAGFAAAHAIEIVRQAVEPGISTLELDSICADALQADGAQSASMLELNAPSHAFFSVNDAIVRGLPTDVPLNSGDVLKINVMAERQGFMSDVAITVPVGVVSERSHRLIEATRIALERGVEAAPKDWWQISRIATAISYAAQEAGMRVTRGSGGHAIGRSLHKLPNIPNEVDAHFRHYNDGSIPIITIEPMLCMGLPQIMTDNNGWTVRTTDGSIAAHFAHTVMLTDRGAVIMTAT